MRRLLSVLWLCWCGLACASLPRDSLARLDYTALVNYWGHVLDGYSYGMDPLGLRTNITRNLGLTTNMVAVGYDNIEQITAWSAKEGLSGPLRLNEQYNYAYDNAGNLWLRTNGGLAQTFNCDGLNQLTNVTRNNAITVSGATPAPATSVTVNGQPAQTYGDFTFACTNLTLGDGNNTFTIAAHSLTGSNATSSLTMNLPQSVALKWDSNGNRTNDGTRSFAYNAENQLTNIAFDSTWKTEFVYDGLGRRRVAKDYGWQGGQWVKTNETRYVYDGCLAIQERDSNNAPRVTYTRGLDLSSTLQGAGGIGGLLARTDSSGSAFYHADGAGNITALMDAQQNMAARYMYGAFGRVTGKWGPMADANIMQFSSMPVHRQSGLSLYPVRAYDPTLQRWLIQDPIGEAGGINLYGFVGNNSINRRDPFGLDYHAVNMMPGNVGGYPLYYGDTLGEDVAVFSQNVGAAAVNIVGGAIGGTEHLIDSTFGSGTTEAAGIYFGMNAGALPELAGALEAVSQKIGSLLSKCTAAKPPANVGKIADDVLEWLGQNSSMSKPPGGSDLVLRSADGTKQIRFDLTNPHGLDPHVNVETFEPRDLFPGDRKMTQTGNDHVFPKP